MIADIIWIGCWGVLLYCIIVSGITEIRSRRRADEAKRNARVG